MPDINKLEAMVSKYIPKTIVGTAILGVKNKENAQ